MFERAREIVAGADAIRSDLAALRGLLEGTVALGTMLPPGPIDLPGLLASFHAEHPGITVRVREGSAPDILAELGATSSTSPSPASSPRRSRTGSRASGCSGEELLLITPPDRRGALAGRALRTCRSSATGAARRCATPSTAPSAPPRDPEIVFETDELVSVRELVARGLGVSIVPRSTVDGDGPAVQAISIGLERPLTVVWRRRRQPPAAAAFLSFVRGALVG